MDNNSITKRIREFINFIGNESNDFSINIKDIVDRFRGVFAEWTPEENYDFRLRTITRNILNSEGYFALGDGEYYNLENGKDEEKKRIILDNQKNSINALVHSLNNKKKEIEDQQISFIVNEEGFIELVDA